MEASERLGPRSRSLSGTIVAGCAVGAGPSYSAASTQARAASSTEMKAFLLICDPGEQQSPRSSTSDPVNERNRLRKVDRRPMVVFGSPRSGSEDPTRANHLHERQSQDPASCLSSVSWSSRWRLASCNGTVFCEGGIISGTRHSGVRAQNENVDALQGPSARFGVGRVQEHDLYAWAIEATRPRPFMHRDPYFSLAPQKLLAAH